MNIDEEWLLISVFIFNFLKIFNSIKKLFFILNSIKNSSKQLDACIRSLVISPHAGSKIATTFVAESAQDWCSDLCTVVGYLQRKCVILRVSQTKFI